MEGSGDDQDTAISEAVNKVVELVDEVVSNLNDNIEDLEVNLADNEIPDTKQKRKCARCVRRVFRARNRQLCEECGGAEDTATSAMTTPASSTPASALAEIINEKRCI